MSVPHIHILIEVSDEEDYICSFCDGPAFVMCAEASCDMAKCRDCLNENPNGKE